MDNIYIGLKLLCQGPFVCRLWLKESAVSFLPLPLIPRNNQQNLEGLPANSASTEPANVIRSFLHLPEGQCSHHLY